MRCHLEVSDDLWSIYVLWPTGAWLIDWPGRIIRSRGQARDEGCSWSKRLGWQLLAALFKRFFYAEQYAWGTRWLRPCEGVLLHWSASWIWYSLTIIELIAVYWRLLHITTILGKGKVQLKNVGLGSGNDLRFAISELGRRTALVDA